MHGPGVHLCGEKTRPNQSPTRPPHGLDGRPAHSRETQAIGPCGNDSDGPSAYIETSLEAAAMVQDGYLSDGNKVIILISFIVIYL